MGRRQATLFSSPAGGKLERSRGEGGILRSGKTTIWFLSGNVGKFQEARAILSPYGITIRHLKRPKLEIQDLKIENVARFALKEALAEYGGNTLVEDSGLFIDALGGFPGPYSSYVYRTIGLKGILNLLKAQERRGAFFQSTIAFGSRTKEPKLFTGRVKGRIARRVSGNLGFGYDPIFIPNGSKKTFGQTGLAVKNVNSHRAKAFRQFGLWFLASSTRIADKRG
ncbi:RdgB/HAM1 family non-canonical purine NTP pyrophosphatase [Candidatus Bathyarchaeota archaeon]|nr:RdgB/HAM1 family non-canonical purine NTP pyrophosphatase [Candidatus Bathyarchaeota archaeon]